MSVQITYGGSVFCEICDTRFSTTDLHSYDCTLCPECVEKVVPVIDLHYEEYKKLKPVFGWYYRTFKLKTIHRIAYNRYIGEAKCDKQHEKEITDRNNIIKGKI